jgi:GTP cyclohydrolase I
MELMKRKPESVLETHIMGAMMALSEIYPEFKLSDSHNVKTPQRIAKAWIEMCRGLGEPDFEFTTFEMESAYAGDWVVLKDIEFSSMCQHHFMPFSGKVHIGYVPSDKIVGISKLARVVDYFAARPQVQERLGDEILDYLEEKLHPQKIAIIIESSHTCVACRGARSRNSKMMTTHSYEIKDVKEFKELIR